MPKRNENLIIVIRIIPFKKSGKLYSQIMKGDIQVHLRFKFIAANLIVPVTYAVHNQQLYKGGNGTWYQGRSSTIDYKTYKPMLY